MAKKITSPGTPVRRHRLGHLHTFGHYAAPRYTIVGSATAESIAAAIRIVSSISANDDEPRACVPGHRRGRPLRAPTKISATSDSVRSDLDIVQTERLRRRPTDRSRTDDSQAIAPSAKPRAGFTHRMTEARRPIWAEFLV